MEQLVELDHEIFLYLNSLGSPAWDPFWLFITDKFSAIPFYGFLVFLLYKSLGLKKAFLTLLFVAGLITLTDQFANLFKHYFQRPRPCGQEGVMETARFIAVRCGRYGFFSAHAASSAGLAVFLGLILRQSWRGILIVLIVWALLVSYSRIYLGVHFPGDIVTGWFFGILFGYLFYRLHQYIFRKYFSNPSSEARRKP